MKIVGLDYSPFKFGACSSKVFQADLLEFNKPIRIEYKASMNGREYSDKERSRLNIQAAVHYVTSQHANLVLIEDTRISFTMRGKNGQTINMSQGYQDYHTKGSLFALEFILEMKGFPVQFVGNSSMISTCMGKGFRTGKKSKDVKELCRLHINEKYNQTCITDDESDAALLIEYYWIKNRYKLV